MKRFAEDAGHLGPAELPLPLGMAVLDPCASAVKRAAAKVCRIASPKMADATALNGSAAIRADRVSRTEAAGDG